MIKYKFYKLKFAICSFDHLHQNGYILFTQYPSNLKLNVKLKNLLPGEYDLYIHEYGNESSIYNSFGLKYMTTPLVKIIINPNGEYNNIINIRNLHLDQIIGRSIIIYVNDNKITYGIIGFCENK